MTTLIRIVLIFSILLPFFPCARCFGQLNHIQIKKEVCTYDRTYRGNKLIIHYESDTTEQTSDVGYNLLHFINLPDTAKLKIVSKLLAFENDTALCCLKVISRSFNGIEGCGGRPDGVDRYDIQVDALYMINRLCWPGFIEAYSCVPVLYDTKKQTTINNDPKKIRIVFEHYIKWCRQCLANGRISRHFPFNVGRYVWYNGHNINIAD